jgi:hypothetical protein
MDRAASAQTRLREHMESAKGLVSFTFDTWTSKNSDPFLSITAHYTSAPSDSPNDWELKTELLAFTHLEGHHTGANIAQYLLRTIDRYGLRGKLSWFTTDNASNNDMALKSLAMAIDPQGKFFNPVKRRIQ